MKLINSLILVLLISLVGTGSEAYALMASKNPSSVSMQQKKKTAKKKKSSKKSSSSSRCDCTVCWPENSNGGVHCRNKGHKVYCKICHKNHIRCAECAPNEDYCGCDGSCQN